MKLKVKRQRRLNVGYRMAFVLGLVFAGITAGLIVRHFIIKVVPVIFS